MSVRPMQIRRVRRNCSSPRSRRGVTILVVLSVISVAMAMSYVVLRSRGTAMRIQSNADRNAIARATAQTALVIGLRKMHENTWSGVGTSASGSLSATESYEVRYVAGDSSLTASNPKYSDLPYRVTLLATGTSQDPSNAQVRSSYALRAVVRLIPRQLASTATNWAAMQQYTVYQYAAGPFHLDVPVRIEGPLRLQGDVQLGESYDWDSSTRSDYLSDLNKMRLGVNEVQRVTRNGGTGTYRLSFKGQTTASISTSASMGTILAALQALSTVGPGNVTVTGSSSSYDVSFRDGLGEQEVPALVPTSVSIGLGNYITVTTIVPGGARYADYRPLSGPINMPLASTNTNFRTLLTDALGLTLTNIGLSADTLHFPTSLATYQLYRGGPIYTVPTLSSTLSNTTLGPDTATNPLGIYFRSLGGTVGSNVTVTGTLVYGGDMTVTGTNVRFLPLNLPQLPGASGPTRLPSAVVNQKIVVNPSVSATVEGLLLAKSQLLFEQGTENTSFSVVGRVITKDVIVRKRSEWDYSEEWWDFFVALFEWQLENNSPPLTRYFPVYVSAIGRSYVPKLTVKPDGVPQVPHWQDLSNPVFVPRNGDGGLMWEVVRWADRP